MITKDWTKNWTLIQSFSLSEIPVKYGIIEEWQTRIQVKQDGDRLKQNSKEKKRFNEC